MYEEFINNMYQVFSKAEKPEKSEITPHRCTECDKIRDELFSHNKEDIEDNLIDYHGDALPLLSPKALKYFIPRYIEYGLLHQKSNAFESTLYHLAPEKIDDYWTARFNIFLKAEKEILIQYLLLRRDCEDSEFDEPYIERGLKFWV